MLPAPFAIHHVGYLVKSINQTATDLIERFNYQVESAIIEDPLQTAFVQFLRLPGASFWIELVAPNGEHSKLSNALRKGGGINHLCYEVPSITDACVHLRGQGMLLIGEPAPARAFDGRQIAWLMDSQSMLVELVEQGADKLSLASLRRASVN
jgi:methylmalonyl-CoA/ethylmalonyl-CoA epimerase